MLSAPSMMVVLEHSLGGYRFNMVITDVGAIHAVKLASHHT